MTFSQLTCLEFCIAGLGLVLRILHKTATSVPLLRSIEE
jgi:hypothetical protein